VPDSWLDWLPEYDLPLGAPSGPATRVPSTSSLTGLASAHVWHRSFASGTSVTFDGGTGQGTIKWGGPHGKTQVGGAALHELQLLILRKLILVMLLSDFCFLTSVWAFLVNIDVLGGAALHERHGGEARGPGWLPVGRRLARGGRPTDSSGALVRIWPY
jgi:hypothetical protein